MNPVFMNEELLVKYKLKTDVLLLVELRGVYDLVSVVVWQFLFHVNVLDTYQN